MNVIARMERAFREHAERRALWAADGACSYRELGAIVGGIARRIAASGAVAGAPARIGVLTGDDVRTYASILAILASGSAYVPLNRKNPAERNRLIAERAELDLVLATRPGPEIEALARALPSAEVVYTEGLPGHGGFAWIERE